MKVTGIYAIVCKVDGRVYVGSAAFNMRHRWRNHRTALQKNKHDNSYLQAAWNKHGEDAFEFVELERCPPDQCIVREQHWIDLKQAVNRDLGFNLLPRAGSSLGFRHTEESKAKVTAFLKGRKLSEETRAKMRAAHAKPTDEYRAKMSAIKKGEVRSPETRAKMSIASRARRASEETRAKIGAASRGRKHNDETKAIISATHKGKKKSPETRAKMSEAVRNRHAANRERRLSLLPPMLSFMTPDESPDDGIGP